MAYSWKFSAALLGVALIAFLILMEQQSGTLAVVTGRSLRAIFDLRFLIIFAVALIFWRKLNPVILALAVGVVRSGYFQATLRDHWERLEIPAPNVFDTFWPAFVAALVLFSAGHATMGMVKAWAPAH